MRTFKIEPLHVPSMEACRLRIDNLTKPIYSLATLESIAERFAGILRNPKPNHLRYGVLVVAAGQSGDLGFADGFAAVREDAFERIVARYAFELLVKLAVDADAQFFGELFPCAVVVFGGVGDDAVEVK